MDTPLLIIFTRNPVKGKVKTRLAASIGDDSALRIYNKLREHTRTVALESGAHLAVYYADHVPDSDIFLCNGTRSFLQNGEDLGTRMLNAFRQGFSDNYLRIALIGTDCPELTGNLLRHAFELLKQHGAVIGPARDGGYYLIGMRRLIPELFINRKWSTPHVYREAMDTFRHNEVDCAVLRQLSDIDTADDLGNFNPDQL